MKKYTYDYPENRELRAGLMNGDQQKLSSATGLKPGTIKKILAGERRMTPEVKQVVKKFIKLNELKG